LETNPRIDKGIIFGSRAKGNYKDGSDIDIAIKGENLKLDDILALKVKLDDLDLPYNIDLINYADIKEPDLTEHIDRVGVEFYSSWKDYQLDEVFDFASGLSKSADQFGYGYDFLSFKDIFDNYFVPNELTSLVNSTIKEQESCSIRYGDVFLTRTSETDEDLGMSCVALKDYPKATFNGFTKRLRPKGDIEILPRYAGFYFRSPKFRAAVSSMSSVTTRASLNNGMLSQLKITVPPIREQQAIADTLTSVHNKINLLHRQNKTLESIAQTLFRQWFVEETSDEFVSLGDYAYNVKEHVKKRNLNIIDHYVGLEHIPKKTITLSNWGSTANLESDKLVFKENDILFGKLRSYFHKVVFAPIDGVCSTDILVIRPKKKEWFSFCLLWFFSKELVDYSDLASGGTRMPRTNWEILANYQIPKPSTQKIEDFEEVMSSQIKKIKSNISQIRSLADLRDTILPKLLSGEARIKMS